MPVTPIIPPDRIDPNVEYRYLECQDSYVLLLMQRQLDAINGISGGFKDKLLQVDTVGTTNYLGYAEAGSDTSATVWAIKRVVEVGNSVVITWADGTKDFDNIWNDRLTLTYS